jgi:hypothetical protein
MDPPFRMGVQFYYAAIVLDVLFPSRHAVHFLAEAPPIVSLQLGIFDPLLTPVLMKSADMILAVLKIQKLIADAFFNENTARMLLHD